MCVPPPGGKEGGADGGCQSTDGRVPLFAYGFAYGVRTVSVRCPYGVRTVSVRCSRVVRALFARCPYGVRALSVRCSRVVRALSVRCSCSARAVESPNCPPRPIVFPRATPGYIGRYYSPTGGV